VDSDGIPLTSQPKLEGKVLRSRDGAYLLKPLVAELLDELQAFHAVPAEKRDQKFKEIQYGKSEDSLLILLPRFLTMSPKRSFLPLRN